MKKLKRLAMLGVAGPALLGSPAMAAPPAPPPPMFTWTGCYIGGNLGFVKQDTSINDVTGGLGLPNNNVGTTNGLGFAGGGQVGCDYQMSSNWVVGVRGMIDATSINQSGSYVSSAGNEYEGAQGIKTNWFATALGRIGYLAGPNLLVYAKGGAAWKHVSYTDSGFSLDYSVSYSGTGSATILGYDVGAGFEYAFIPNLSAFVELDYMGFPSTGTTLTYAYTFLDDTRLGYPQTRTFDYTHDILAILVGMNWRFH